MNVSDVMTRDPQTIAPDETLRRAAEMMDDLNVGVLPVCDGERLVGIITDRDITVRATAVGLDPETTTVSDVMSDEVRWCFEDDDVEAAERLMSEMQIRRIPIVNREKHLVGILTLGDLATKHVPGVRETLDHISQPSRPDR